ncbi:hypothetical protein LCGC14_2226670 [marine sediment metagenome]|uniref:Uncharacterized protein n=1 Tax=marine sediment metagenome TaxID=412755 RepID=A0A0F9FM07_9ZZZZ
MIKLTLQVPFDGSTEWWVNPDQMEGIGPHKKDGSVFFAGGRRSKYINVTETPEEIKQLILEWTTQVGYYAALGAMEVACLEQK